MNQVYLIEEAHLCDDSYFSFLDSPQSAPPHTVGVYASEPLAQEAVAKYEKECRLAFAKQNYAGKKDDDLWEMYAKRWVMGAIVHHQLGETK